MNTLNNKSAPKKVDVSKIDVLTLDEIKDFLLRDEQSVSPSAVGIEVRELVYVVVYRESK